MDSVRVAVDVHAGLIPGQPMEEYSRRWFITSSQWQAAGEATGPPKVDQSQLLAEMNGRAQGYAMLLMLQPDRLNWVKTEWVWF